MLARVQAFGIGDPIYTEEDTSPSMTNKEDRLRKAAFTISG
jgi:hypothetical protein